MTDEQIINAKSNEIKRLHLACQAKDEAINKAISFLDSFALPTNANVSEQNKEQLIIELESYLG